MPASALRARIGRSQPTSSRIAGRAHEVGRSIDDKRQSWPTPEELYTAREKVRELEGRAAALLIELRDLGVNEELFKING